MAIGIDLSKRKPRRVKGTPAAVVRNRIGYGVLAIGTLFGLAFHFSSISLPLRTFLTDHLYEDPIEEIERKQLMSFPFYKRTGDTIRKVEEELNRIDLPDK